MWEKKYEEELAEDIMKILTCYSARYYGARMALIGFQKAEIKKDDKDDGKS